MTIQGLHDYFDLLVDKTGNPYFIPSEKDQYINMAQIEYIKRTLPSNEGGVVNIEESEEVTNNVISLVYEVSGLIMDVNGLVSGSLVQSTLDALTGGTSPYMYVMNVSWDKTGAIYPVEYTKHNDWYRLQLNSFKKGVASRPRYRFNASGFVFAPIDVGATISMSLLKQPVDVDFDLGITSELPPHTHKSLVEIAVELSAVSTREGDLSQLNGKQRDA